jgi:hypothetical protein
VRQAVAYGAIMGPESLEPLPRRCQAIRLRSETALALTECENSDGTAP